jgi:arylsulfatase A-like enzyme
MTPLLRCILCLFTAILPAALSAQSSAGRTAPNIVLILIDDLGYGDLGCYGSPINQTPNIDRLAREGTRFTDFYVSDSVCSPSRAALLTGCYSERVGMHVLVNTPGGALGLHPNEITIAEVLKTAGYKTACFGKWHLGDQYEFLPRSQGFDSFLGLPYSHDIAPPYIAGGRKPAPGSMDAYHASRNESKSKYPPLPLVRDYEVIEQQPDPSHLTDRWTDAAIAFIDAHQRERFFLYLAHTDVHLPFHALENDRRASRNGDFGAALIRLDRSIGRLMDKLRTAGLDQNTLVVFLSDNGTNSLNPGQSNAPLRGAKGNSWEGGHRVPFIARWPKHIPAGRTVAEPAISMDIFPTLARLAGAKIPDDRIIDGRDIWPLLAAEPGAKSPHETFYFYSRGRLDAIRWQNWKYYPAVHSEKIVMSGDTNREYPSALYNLALDIAESRNVAHEFPEIVTRMKGYADEAIHDLGDTRTKTVGVGRRPAGNAINPKPLAQPGPIPSQR